MKTPADCRARRSCSIFLLPRLFLAFCLGFSVAEAQNLSVVVEAQASGRPGSRDAHFNWSFQSSGGGNVQMGQFSCGSYWVAPANGDTGVTVLSLTGKTDDPNWHDFVSCDVDPITESHGLLDGSNNYGSYNAAENIIPNLPLTYTPASNSCISLVAAMQRNEAETTPGGTSAIVGEVADAYCIVTVLPSVPANNGADMIRPNITGTTKELLTWSDFDLDQIPTYSFLEGMDATAWSNATSRWRHTSEIFGMLVEVSPGVWYDRSEGGRAFRAHIVVPNYAAQLASRLNNDIFALLSAENTLVEKKPTLAALLAYGLDIYHNRYDYGSNKRKGWESGAGQWQGEFMPVALLAALQTDKTKAEVLQKAAITNHDADEGLRGPQELRQIIRGVTGVLLWGDFTPFIRNGNSMTEGDWRHWDEMLKSGCFDSSVLSCNAGAATKKTVADPYGYIDGPSHVPGTTYMETSAGPTRDFAAIMILFPEIRRIVNTDNPIEYTDRIARHGTWTYPDPVAPPSAADQLGGCETYWSAKNCVDWGITWGADLTDVRFGIENGSGRFTSRHGDYVGFGNSSWRGANNWSIIIQYYDGDTYEDSVVPLGTLVAPEILFERGSNPKAHFRTPHYLAEMRYTLDGTDPTSSSNLYTGPISVSDGTEVRAKAFQSGKTASAIRSRTYIVPVADTMAPNVPSNFSYSNLTGTSVDLTWDEPTDNSGSIFGYRLYTNGGDRMDLPTNGATVTGLSLYTEYDFQVTALDKAGNESNAASISLTTPIENGYHLSLNQPVDASSYYSSNYPPEQAVDGDTEGGSRWLSDYSDAQWIDVDLGEHCMVINIVLTWSGAYGSAYNLRISDDGVNWTTFYSETNGDGGTDNITGLNVYGRYVRMEGITRATVYGYSLYEFEVRGVPYVDVSADTEAPSVPTGLTSSNVTTTSADLSWNASSDNVGVTGYRVYLDSTYVTTTSETSTTLSGLAEDTTYAVSVSAVDGASNESAQSTALSLTTQGSVPLSNLALNQPVTAFSIHPNSSHYPEDAVDGNTGTRWLSAYSDDQWIYVDLGSSYNISSVVLLWSGAYGAEYDIEVSNDAVNWTKVYSETSGDGGTDTISGLSASARYVRMLGISRATSYGYSLYEFEVWGGTAAPDTEAPSVPTGLVSSNVTETTVDLDWNASTDNVGVAIYNVYTNGGSPVQVSTNSVTLTGLSAGVSYTFTVSAEDTAQNESAQSSGFSVTMADLTAPSIPDGLASSNVTTTSADISWNAATDNVGVTGYNVYLDSVYVGSAPGTTTNLTGLSGSTTYLVTVSAFDAASNESAQSNALSVTTQTPAPLSNLALNQPVTAFSTHPNSSHYPEDAVDGNTGTRWLSAYSDDQWIYVDLGSSYNISSVVLLWSGAYGAEYDIEVSNDAVNWTKVYSETSGDGGTDTISGLSASARYVRMLGISRATVYGYSLYEFEVWGN